MESALDGEYSKLKRSFTVFLMVSLLLFAQFTVLLNIRPAYASVDLIDSYSTSNYDYDVSLTRNHPSNNASVSGGSQSFTMLSTTHKITSCIFYLKKVGLPTGNAHAVLYSHSGTYGTNSIPTWIALATSDNFDVSTLTTSYQNITFTFTNPQQYVMAASTKYCIAFLNPASGITTAKYVVMGGDSSSQSHSGNPATYYSSKWNAKTTFDMCFYVYGESEIPSGTMTLNPMAQDGNVREYNTPYLQCWNDTLGEAISATAVTYQIGQCKYGVGWRIWRAFTYFNLTGSGITSNTTITSIVLSVMFSAIYKDDGNYTLKIEQPTPDYVHPQLSLDYPDYFYIHYVNETEVGSMIVGTSTVINTYYNITLANTCLNLTASDMVMKFILRTGMELNQTAPGSGNSDYVNMYSNEKGAGYCAILYITYSNAVLPPPAPVIQDFAINATWAGQGCQWNFAVTDMNALANATFGCNVTASFVNDTVIALSGTYANFLINHTLPASNGIVAFQLWLYNTYSNLTTTGLRYMKVYTYNSTAGAWNTPFVNLGTAMATVESSTTWSSVGTYLQTLLDEQSGSATSAISSLIDSYDIHANPPETLVYCNNASGTDWYSPNYAYDNNTGTGAAYTQNSGSGDSSALTLNTTLTIQAGVKIQYYVYNSTSNIDHMYIDVANETGDWTNVYSVSSWPTAAYANATFQAVQYTALRFIFHFTGACVAVVYEVQALANSTISESNAFNILQTSAYSNKLGIERQQALNDSLRDFVMAGALPKTGLSQGQAGFCPQSKWALYGFYYANESWTNGAWNSKWNITAAYTLFTDTVHAAGTPPLWIFGDGGYSLGSDRYYDEDACVIECFIIFSQLLNVSGAMDEALYWWSYLDSTHWSSLYGGYYKYTPVAAEPEYECEAGFFLKIVSILKYYNVNLDNWDRVLTDIGNRFLASKWNSSQWMQYASNTTDYVVVHAYSSNNQTRLRNTLGAWQALSGVYFQLNSTYENNMIDMLYGNSVTEPAWALLLTPQAALFNSTSNQFRSHSYEEGIGQNPPTDATSSAIGEILMFMLGMVPGTATVAFPLEELDYEYIYDMDPAIMQMNINTTARQIVVPVNNAGTMTFQYGASPITYSFSESGTWLITFSPSWNMITNVVLTGGLPSNVIYFSQIYSVPLFSSTGTNSTVAGSACLFSVSWTDSAPNVNVAGFYFGTNNTGTWVNETWCSDASLGWGTASAWGNVTKTLSSTAHALIQWEEWVIDTSGNWNSTGILTFFLGFELTVSVTSTSTFSASFALSRENLVQVTSTSAWSGYNFQFKEMLFLSMSSPSLLSVLGISHENSFFQISSAVTSGILSITQEFKSVFSSVFQPSSTLTFSQEFGNVFASVFHPSSTPRFLQEFALPLFSSTATFTSIFPTPLKELGFQFSSLPAITGTFGIAKEFGFPFMATSTFSSLFVPFKEFAYSPFASLVQFSSEFSTFKDLGFQFTSAPSFTSALSINKEFGFFQASQSTWNSLFTSSRETMVQNILYAFTSSASPSSMLITSMEFEFQFTSTPSLSSVLGFNRENSFSSISATTTTSIMKLAQEVGSLFVSSQQYSSVLFPNKELGFQFASTLILSSLPSNSKEFLSAFTSTSSLNSLLVTSKEVAAQVLLYLFTSSASSSSLFTVSKEVGYQFSSLPVFTSQLFGSKEFCFPLTSQSMWNSLFATSKEVFVINQELSFTFTGQSDWNSLFFPYREYISVGWAVPITGWIPINPTLSLFNPHPLLLVEPHWPTLISDIKALYTFMLMLAYPAHIQIVSAPPVTATVNVNIVTVITVPSLNYSMVVTHTLDGNQSISEDVLVPLPLLGRANYDYHVSTTYLFGNTLIAESSMDGTLAVQAWWIWLWAGIVAALTLTFIGLCAGTCLWRRKKRNNKLKLQKNQQVIRGQRATILKMKKS